ncbi:MAG TPA: amidohydrolase family protein [Burkholderiales bacterium]|nr:amidohydrolase family protein [Burkholderiales bacterium]
MSAQPIGRPDPGTWLFSSDDHLDLCYVPPTMWQERVPAKWKAEAPKVQTDSKGRTVWFREGRPWGVQGSKKLDGRKVVFDEVGLAEEPEPGVFRAASAKYRLQDMDRDGIYAQVMYNFLDWGFENPELKEACLLAFNDWIAEFCAADRNRLIGLAVLPTHDPQAAMSELDRTTKLGLRGAMFEFTGATTPVYDKAWDPLWAAAAESGTAISFHIMTKRSLTALNLKDYPWLLPAQAAVACLMLNEIMSQLIYSGITLRHPKLKLVLAESSLGWLPFVLERLEFEQHNYKHVQSLPKVPAGEIFRRSFYCTFQEEKLGVQLIPKIGEDNVMWAADYPHGDGSFPRSRQAVDSIFEGVDPRIKAKATRDNMKNLYRIS